MADLVMDMDVDAVVIVGDMVDGDIREIADRVEPVGLFCGIVLFSFANLFRNRRGK